VDLRLSGAFGGNDASYTSFKYAQISRLAASFSQFIFADFSGAQDVGLGVTIDNAPIHHINFEGASFSSLSITDSSGERPNFSNGFFPGADFTGSSMQFASFNHSDLVGSKFIDAFLRNADFSNANLNGADFTGADLNGAVFTGADLTGATLACINHPICI
jgi:uncharacterized protein YjbI with pentapeptide repeats